MLNIEVAGYAALPGFLALVAAVLMVPGVRRSIDWSSPIFPRDLFNASAWVIPCLFLLILIFIEPGFSSIAFLAGILSTVLFLIFSLALFKSPGTHLSDREDRFKGWSLGLAAQGLALTAIGIYLMIFGWEDVSILIAYASGAACALVPVTAGAGKVKEGDADLYISSLCVLAAAMSLGAAMTDFQQVWVEMPVLFAVAGLTILLAAAVVMRVAAHGRPWFYRCMMCLFALSAVIVSYVIPGELTRKMSSDIIAGLGMLDRMGPFWAFMTGVLTGVLLIILTRYSPSSSERRQKNRTFGFILYFMAVGIWISYLFADLYGIAFAGVGMLGVAGLPAGQRTVQSVKMESGRIGVPLGASAFSTLALVAACLASVRGAADFDNGLTEMVVLAGFILGTGTACIMRPAVKRASVKTPEGSGIYFPFMSPYLSSCLVFIFIPTLIGLAAGPEIMGGFLPGMILTGVCEVLKMDKEDDTEDAERLNGLMRLAALAVLVAAPLMGF